MFIGLTGSLAAGKGVVSEFLKERGFIYMSTSDEVRRIALERKIPWTRENLQNLGNQLRKEGGAGVLGKIIIEKIRSQGYNKAIIDGIRNPAEVEELKKLDGFFLLCVDAPQEIRFQRMKERNRESDPMTWEEFVKVDEKDKGIGEEESGQQVEKVMKLADYKITNDSSIEEINSRIQKIYNEMLRRIPRPSWDQYFMKMASLVAERSTCLRHHVGSIIVKGKRILTSGYNGAARGMVDCIQVGCLRDALGIPSGERHEICRAIHAEQNAIIQAGIHGINIDGGSMYCTHSPCMICAKMIANAGIKEVVSYQDYADKDARKFLEDAGILLRKIKRPRNVIEFKD